MDTLKTDVEPFLVAVEEIYGAALDPNRLPEALQAIADCFGDVGAILLWQRETGAFGSLASPAVRAAQRDYEENGWMARDLRGRRAAERGYFFSGAPFTDRHVCSEEEIRTDPSYTEFQAAHGLKWFAAAPVSPSPGVGVLLSVHRGAGREPFSDEELARLGRLGQHLEKSLRIGVGMFESQALQGGLGEALSRAGIGVFVLDQSGRITFVNASGETMLGDGVTVQGGRLTIGDERARIALAAVCRSVGPTEPGVTPLPVPRRHAQRPLALYFLPISRRSDHAAWLAPGACAIVLALDPDASDPPDPALIRDILGLTLGEARIATLIASGLAPRATSERLGVSEATVRSALKMVFMKTGVSRQSELANLMSRLTLKWPLPE